VKKKEEEAVSRKATNQQAVTEPQMMIATPPRHLTREETRSCIT
jgi:hypothetical protein